MRLLALALLTATLVIVAPTPSWAPEPGMGRDNDHNSNAGGSNSSPGHEGSSNRDTHHQKSNSGYYTNDPATRSREQWERLDGMSSGSGRYDRNGNPSPGPRGGGVTPGSQDRNF